jgi:hypothetical protein
VLIDALPHHGEIGRYRPELPQIGGRSVGQRLWRQPAKLRIRVRYHLSDGVAVRLPSQRAAAPMLNAMRKRERARETRLPSGKPLKRERVMSAKASTSTGSSTVANGSSVAHRFADLDRKEPNAELFGTPQSVLASRPSSFDESEAVGERPRGGIWQVLRADTFRGTIMPQRLDPLINHDRADRAIMSALFRKLI